VLPAQSLTNKMTLQGHRNLSLIHVSDLLQPGIKSRNFVQGHMKQATFNSRSILLHKLNCPKLWHSITTVSAQYSLRRNLPMTSDVMLT